MKEVYIISAVRTPMGSFGGSLKGFSATKLGSIAIKGALEKAGLAADKVDDVIMGSVIQANLGQAPARQAAKFAGLANEVNCTTVNKVCASGMKAIAQAAQSIMLGDADIVIAGGMESMTNVPFYADSMRWGNKYGNTQFIDGLAKDGLTDVYDGKAMGNAAELCAGTCGISRVEQDEFAIESYKRSQAAVSGGKFDNEIVPVSIPQRSGDPLVFAKDEEPFNVKFDKIPGHKGAFVKDGTVTAGNSSGINDGAAAMLLASEAAVTKYGLQPMAKIMSMAVAGVDPAIMGIGPVPATNKALQRAGLQVADLDLIELNEAFASQSIACIHDLGLDLEKVNVNGGAIALGHPLGCSGVRISTTLLHEMKKRKSRYGLATMCVGVGQGSAIIYEAL